MYLLQNSNWFTKKKSKYIQNKMKNKLCIKVKIMPASNPNKKPLEVLKTKAILSRVWR